ncbi:MAG: 4-alpha-glucanotransferase [Deltaproteobacteria bacterium]|nr:4-alpha-glucanotransferase [Deltaproteobacteria bacterium]
MKRRGSGVLLHLTSLPSPFGIGDMGPWAYRFVDFLAEAGQSFWQILPLSPTDQGHGNSPYHSTSAFAGNPLLISPESMVESGLLEERDLDPVPDFPSDRVDYRAVTPYKRGLLERAFEGSLKKGEDCEFRRFCMENASWLEEFAFFTALKAHMGKRPWNEWPEQLRDRAPEALESVEQEICRDIEVTKFSQYLFSKQWHSLKEYCHQRGIQIIGDLPIYVNYDSADLWSRPELFKLNEQKRPYVVAGVPPDYFSETGQLWGNPIYRWDVMKQEGYRWWADRLRRNMGVYDFVRIDHFRGLVAFWEVPAGEETAVNGKWIEAPAMDLFHHLARQFPCLPIIAEDLGVITPDVREIMNHFEFPGMKVLLFAFGGDLSTNPYIPHNLERNCVAYTGTHDNNTVRGWFETELTREGRERLFRYLGREVRVDELHWELVRLLMMSVANTVIFPMQDILGLGQEARMNRPATSDGNWQWRLLPDHLGPGLASGLHEMTETYGRV